jgi:transcription antitermination protein NusB
MLTSRHQAREIALQILYQYDLSPPSHLVSQNQENPENKQADIRFHVSNHFHYFKVATELHEFIHQLVSGTLCSIETLDPLIEKAGSQWKVARMSAVDRSLLRMAVYEMKILANLAPSIVIDEAIELAKEYGSSESPPFINGILDAIQRLNPNVALPS